MRNTGVTVSLVVFMVLSLILGVTTYIGAKGTSEKKMQVASFKKATSDAQSRNSSMKNELSSLKEKVGYAAVEDNNQLVDTMKKDVVDALGAVEANMTYRDVVLALSENLKRKNEELKSYQAQQNAAQAIAGAQQEMTASQKQEFDDKLDNIKTEHDSAVAKANTSKNELQASYDAQKKELDEVVAKTKDAIQAANQRSADYQEAAEKFQEINKELSEQVDKLANADFARADATVVYADQFLKTARLNVGLKDGVQPLTTFNIFKPTALDMDKEVAKGSVQVVRALGDHLCEVKILEDEMSNPIMIGDLAYTPLWRPGKTIKYGLDYRLDIDGDGASDLEKLMTIIRSSGAEVSVYFTDEGELEGEITPDLYRVVRSDRDIIDVLEHDSTRGDADREALARRNADFFKNAKENGVPEITLADFLKGIGYKETAKISRYREKEGVDLQDDGVVLPSSSPGVVAPSYELNPDKAPESPGIVAPTYRKDSQPAPVSTGKVSDFYFRKRTENAQ